MGPLEEALDHRRFAAWMAGYRDTAIGIPGQPAACPLAVYLHEVLPSFGTFHVGRTKVHQRPLPPWAVQFVEAVDRQAVPLTGEEAGNLLLLALDRARAAEHAPRHYCELRQAAGRRQTPGMTSAPVTVMLSAVEASGGEATVRVLVALAPRQTLRQAQGDRLRG